MCLYTNQILPIRARKDIICYKVLRPVLSYNTGFIIGKTVKFETPVTKTPVNVPGTLIAGRCFLHFPLYRNTLGALYSIDKGFIHTYTSIYVAERSFGRPFAIARCTIPKGTLYFISYDKVEICAERIILNHIIKK